MISVKSVEMFLIFQEHYNPQWEEQKACFLWCGGASYRYCNVEGREILRNYWKMYLGSNDM